VQTLAFWTRPFAYLQWCRGRYGETFTVRVSGFPPLVFLSNPEQVKSVITARADVLHPGEGARTIEPLVGGESFMLEEEQQHLAGRRAILPPFHHKVIERHSEMVRAIAERASADWPLAQPVALHPHLRAMSLEVILRTVFQNADLDDERLYLLRDRLLQTLTVTASPVFPEPALRHGPGRRIWERFLARREEVDELIYTLIGEREGTLDPVADEEHPNTLDALLAASNPDGRPMSARQIHDNLMSMILAGHETTASQLAWTLLLLAHNPRVLESLHAEIDGGEGESYLTATVQEALRHRPVFVFTIPRAVAAPIQIADFTYNPPVHLLGGIYLIHHDPAFYPEPERFAPERFLDAPPTPSVWLPWGGGRKRCPGLHLAMLEMKTALRAILSRVTVLPASRHLEHPAWRSVIVTPHRGARVILQPRRHLRLRGDANHPRQQYD
jgi:hypothetical protein